MSHFDMSNLLEETTKVLSAYGKDVKNDILWIGTKSGNYGMSWKEFAVMADKEYDQGFGSQEVANDLVVVGEDWWLERHEYDGSECWKFKEKPHLKVPYKKVGTVFTDGSAIDQERE